MHAPETCSTYNAYSIWRGLRSRLSGSQLVGHEGMGDGLESNLIGSCEHDMCVCVCVCVCKAHSKMSKVVLNIIILCL